jgi:hypothetical protein
VINVATPRPRGRIALYVHHVDDLWPPKLEVFDDLDHLSAHVPDLAPEAIAAAASELGQARVVWRDIETTQRRSGRPRTRP